MELSDAVLESEEFYSTAYNLALQFFNRVQDQKREGDIDGASLTLLYAEGYARLLPDQGPLEQIYLVDSLLAGHYGLERLPNHPDAEEIFNICKTHVRFEIGEIRYLDFKNTLTYMAQQEMRLSQNDS